MSMMIWYKFKESILKSPAKRDKLVLVNLVLSLLINVAILAALIFYFSRSSEYVVLKYNMYFGISSFGSWYFILLIPLLGLLVGAVNFLWCFKLYLKEKELSYFLAITTSVFAVLMAVVASIITYVNI